MQFLRNTFSLDHLDRDTGLAFALLVLIGGSNAVAVQFSNLELPPFWGAAIRFAAAALIIWIIVLVRRLPIPRGRTLAGFMVYGSLSIGASYAFLYWGLLEVPAGMTMVVLALVPLMTFFFALAHKLEEFRLRGLMGALIAFTGILLGVGGGLGDGVPLPSLLAVAAAAACIAESGVIFKLLPKSHPISVNAIALATGSTILFLVSLLAGEVWILPISGSTWAAFGYLTLVGSVALFYLVLFVLGRWSASATSYAFLLFPVATVIIAALVSGETVTPSFVFGTILVLTGVVVGAFGQSSQEAGAMKGPSPEHAEG